MNLQTWLAQLNTLIWKYRREVVWFDLVCQIISHIVHTFQLIAVQTNKIETDWENLLAYFEKQCLI